MIQSSSPNPDKPDFFTTYSAKASNFILAVNWSKPKMMHVGDRGDPNPITTDRGQAEFVSIFNYLGSMVSNIGNPKIEMHRRKSLATASMRSLWQPL